MIKRLSYKKVAACFVFLFLIIFLTNPQTYMQATLNGITVWFYNVLPALLPFFIGTRLLVHLSVSKLPFLDYVTQKFFKVKNGGKIFFLSLISGYPIGAKLICDAYNSGQLDKKSANKMMSFCSVSGPMFIIGSIGVGVFKSVKIGYILLLCHIIGAVINGLIFRNSYKNINDNQYLKESPQDINSNMLADSMLDSIISILLVGGYIVLAYVFIALLNNLNIVNSIISLCNNIPFINSSAMQALINGLVEMTSGLVTLGANGVPIKICIPIAGFLIGFGGISIFLQSLNFTKTLKIKKSYFLFQKFCQGMVTLLISLFFCF